MCRLTQPPPYLHNQPISSTQPPTLCACAPPCPSLPCPLPTPLQVVPTAGLPLDDLLAIALLVFFGVQTLRSAATADTTAAEEKEEAQEVVDGFGSGETAGCRPLCVGVL